MRRSFRRNSRGQVLVVTSLLVALLLLSTAMYVVETQKNPPLVTDAQDNVYPAYQQSIRNTVISALANVTGGGNPDVLQADLDELTLAFASHSYDAILKIAYTPQTNLPYESGFWISWGADGRGVSSVYVGFAFNSSGFSTAAEMVYAVNVTSQVNLSGNAVQVNESCRQVNLAVSVFNEGAPALAQSFAFTYQNGTEQIAVEAPVVVDGGDGTYSASFFAGAGVDPLVVCMSCRDQRGIFIGANATCTLM